VVVKRTGRCAAGGAAAGIHPHSAMPWVALPARGLACLRNGLATEKLWAGGITQWMGTQMLKTLVPPRSTQPRLPPPVPYRLASLGENVPGSVRP
jgi:hypothetical protein